MKPLRWERTGFPAKSVCAGWHLMRGLDHLGTVFADGSWFCVAQDLRCNYVGSQPLAAQALLRAAGVEQ